MTLVLRALLVEGIHAHDSGLLAVRVISLARNVAHTLATTGKGVLAIAVATQCQNLIHLNSPDLNPIAALLALKAGLLRFLLTHSMQLVGR